MNKALKIGTVGVIAGALDLIPLVMVKAPMLNMIAIVCFWIVTAIFISETKLVKNSLLNGLIVAVLIMLPVVMTVYTVNPKDFLPMLSMAVILGPIAGLALEKL
ncbi:hypothetical protein [Spirochaeta isovalerica]|uniref:DUF1097 domain-containing protein n=1 Tax=Spirochaeta isovalerica TaxID=150 RepID=A0A841RET4_9SPIO|nr:hypothetical protein [Spirochaeta isovalerica]MBB6481118.1 hypothetical protein [Spirochaeta isovalerica]